jgi:tetratricopeptide (TPR) repeat protein
LEQAILTCTEQALTLIKARRFTEARAQLERMVSRVRHAQNTIPTLRLNLLAFARLLSLYGAVLTRLEQFPAAAFAFTQARECLHHLMAKALRQGFRRTHQSLRISLGVVDLEQAYLALRQRAYPQAMVQAARILKRTVQNGDAQNVRWLRANAHVAMGWAHYEQRQYQEAREQVTRALALDPALEGAESLDTLTRLRLLRIAGKDNEVLAVGVAGLQRLVSEMGIACPQEATRLVHLPALMRAISAARRNPQAWAQVMPDEREEIGEFLAILGAQRHAQGHMLQALRLLLLAGSLLPQADVIDIPEFERVTRELGERALREPRAFAMLQTLLRLPQVRQRWEFLEAVVEAMGRVPLGPALASIAALKTHLTGNLPAGTRALMKEIQTDLEQALQIDGETARAIGMQVLSSTSVRFVVTTAFPLDKREVLLNLMEAVIRRWRLREAGMADPEPSTPETEYLTDILEDRLVQRFAAPDAQQRNSTAFFRCAGPHV